MRWPLPSGDRWRAAIRRLDHAAGWINPILMIVAACLLILDLSCVAALEISRMPAMQPDKGGKDETPIAVRPEKRADGYLAQPQ